MQESKWAKPQVVTDLDLALGGRMNVLLPPMSEIPVEFAEGRSRWSKFASDWFFNGISTTGLKGKDGIDVTMALRHLSAIQSSFDPSHEHKEAAVSWLASLWFDAASTWEVNKKE